MPRKDSSRSDGDRGRRRRRDGGSRNRNPRDNGSRDQGSHGNRSRLEHDQRSHGSRSRLDRGDPLGDAPAGRRARPNQKKRGASHIEGRHPIEEALAAGVPLAELMVADRLAPSERDVDPLIEKARAAGVPARLVPRDVLDRLSAHGAHQGVMATMRPYAYATLDDLVHRAAGKANALIVICDHVTDPGNLGAIIRSAEVVGADGVLIPNRRAAEVTATAYKSSAGAAAHLPVAREANLASCCQRLKDEGFWIAGASEHAQDDVWHAPLEGRIALVLGSEGDGISRLMLDRCDFLVRLPQRGRVESLNVAQSGTALMYEWLRRTMADEVAAASEDAAL
jgi:23S rRNA (guanosine2251-2'-O)-methyltransferase